jgi:hypothetical protein
MGKWRRLLVARDSVGLALGTQNERLPRAKNDLPDLPRDNIFRRFGKEILGAKIMLDTGWIRWVS